MRDILSPLSGIRGPFNTRRFDPSLLFRLSEPGAWYEPGDLTTMFTDTAGTTPATVGSAVALMLDKSQGLVLGPERISNGDFSNGSTSWILDTGWAVASGQATFTAQSANRAITQIGLPAAVAGRVYEVSYTVVENTLNAGLLRVGAFSGSSMFGSSAINLASTVGPQVAKIFVSAPSGTGTVFDLWVTSTATSGSITIDNISVRELPGNHATQSTLGNRPILSREPASGRRNLLTYTEQFDNAAWSKTRAAVTANAAIAPDGTTTADKIVENTDTNTHSVSQIFSFTGPQTHTLSVYLKASERTWARVDMGTAAFGADRGAYFDLTNGVLGTVDASTTATITSVGSGWYRCTVTATSISGGLTAGYRVYPATGDGVNSYTGDGTSGILVWGAQLEVGSTATAYQRVVTARDITEAGVADRYYLFFDGSDDWLVTPTIDPSTATSDGAARRNLLTFPSAFDNAVWVKTDATVTANSVVAPDGTTSADLVQFSATNGRVGQIITLTAATQFTFSIWVRVASGTRTFTITDNISNVFGTIVATTEWQRFSVTFTGTGAGAIRFVDANASGFVDTYIWGAQLEVGSTATAFQDIGTDKAQVFAGVRKLSDAATAFVLEFSADTNSNNGAFYLAAPIISGATRSFGAVSKGTSLATTFMAGNTTPAPVSAILTHTADISGDVSTLRANGTQVAQVFTDQGTGNFLAYQLYIGRRGGTTLPFNGHLYGLIVRFGDNLGAATIASTEAYMNRRTGAY